jgi:hypothetical protein
MSAQTTKSGSASEPPRSDVGPLSSFFFGMSIVTLLIVLAGFSPTFYLRTFFDGPPLPGHLYVHGAVLTGWFVWLVVQTSLIRAEQVATHRRLGMVGAVIGLGVVVAGPLASLNVVSGVRAAGYDLDMDISALGAEYLGANVSIGTFLSGTVWVNFSQVLTFLVLLLSAILLRRRPQAHKRLMLLATISIIGPALVRISHWPMLGGEQGPLIPLVTVLLLAALVAHDLFSTRRVHPATLIGAGFAFAMLFAGVTIGASEFGERVVRAM